MPWRRSCRMNIQRAAVFRRPNGRIWLLISVTVDQRYPAPAYFHFVSYPQIPIVEFSSRPQNDRQIAGKWSGLMRNFIGLEHAQIGRAHV